MLDQYDYDIETFPPIFAGLFAGSLDPSGVVKLLQDNPRDTVVLALVNSTWMAVSTTPTNVEMILSNIRLVLDDKRVQALTISLGELGFGKVVGRYFCGYLLEIAYDNSHNKTHWPDAASVIKISPNNRVMVATLLQAVSTKLALDPLLHMVAVCEGLEIEGLTVEENAVEVCAVSSLIVIAILGGKRTVANYLLWGGTGKLWPALMALRARNVIKYKPALALLEKVIVEVKEKSPLQRTSGEVWNELFPE